MDSKCNINKITDLIFSAYQSQDIEKLSVLNVTSCDSVNSLGHYIKNGVYDLRMGPSPKEEKALCETCKQNSYKCPGHYGHINLALPSFNPFFIDALKHLLERICFNCKRFQIADFDAVKFGFQKKLFETGFAFEALNVAEMASQMEENLLEAEEDNTGKKNKRSNGKKRSAALTIELQKALKKYYSVIKNNNSYSSLDPTNGSQAVYLELFSNFKKQTKAKPVCFHCDFVLAKLSFQNACLYINNSEKLKSIESLQFTSSQRSLTASQAMDIARGCWNKYARILSMMYPFLDSFSQEHPTDIFFMNKLVVIPPKFRPCEIKKGMFEEHELSNVYKSIIRISMCLSYLESQKSESFQPSESISYLVSEIKGETLIEKKYSLWIQLQQSVNQIYDTALAFKQSTSKGIRQIIEKKEGLFRQNLMGKRVNFSARSVAAPDPMIAVDEVGVPQEFAMKLTFPVAVTPFNAAKLRQLVINGPHIYPGVNVIEDEKGFVQSLTYLDEVQRKGIASKLLTPLEKGSIRKNSSKIVYRHLENGDYVLMNRQPTLHKPSIQAHKARVMPKDRVLRMPYANCKAYNADFDGDELNLHFLQNDLAQSEAKYLITSHNQYLTPKDGSPLAGLIQDSVVASVMLTVRGKFFPREDYQQLVYISLSDKRGKIQLQPPAIMKPEPLWSGKQIISTILHNIIPKHRSKPSFSFKTTLKVEIWDTHPARKWKAGGSPLGGREAMTESEFVMLNGELLCGVIDKSAIGSSMYGLVHTCYDLYGGPIATQLLTSISRLCVNFLQWSGHTLSIKEFIADQKTDATRRSDLRELIASAPSKVSEKLNLDGDLSDYVEQVHMSERQKDLDATDAAYTSVLGKPTSTITSENEKNLISSNLNNRMRMMVNTGAKGSKVNMNQMASLFGVVALDGKRMPMSINGKTLPYFKPYDPTPQCGGYIPYRFMTGIELKSYFFLCIVGRDSLQHTAVKTSNSGYVQRCLIKHLEGIKVEYDLTVRNSDGVVLQFEYGEDGLDVTKIPFLKDISSLNVVVDNCPVVKEEPISLAKEIKKHKKKIKKWKKPKRTSAFLHYCKKLSEVEGIQSKAALIRTWTRLDLALKNEIMEKISRCPDPVTSVFCKSSQLGVVSEALERLIDEFYEKYSKRDPNSQALSKDEVYHLIYRKFQQSLAEPGEAVGAICAQALGEPLTQMTLNTFHFAGRDELNVTLGVPRMIEILRTGTKFISTPIMRIPFLPHITLEEAEAFKQTLVPIPFSKVIEKVKIITQLKRERSSLVRSVKLKFIFLSSKHRGNITSYSNQQILRAFEEFYVVKVFINAIGKAIEKKASFSKVQEIQSFEQKSLEKEEEEAEEKTDDKEKSSVGLDEDSEDEAEDFEEASLGLSGESRKFKSFEQDYDEDDDDDDAKEKQICDEFGLMMNGEQHSKLENMEDANDEEIDNDLENLPFSESVLSKSTNLSHQWISQYAYDEVKFSWCQINLNLPVADGKYDILSILKETLEKTNLNINSNIKKAYVVEDKDKKNFILSTEGVDTEKIFLYDNFLDLNSFYTNDIHVMANTYGIEAAQRCIIKEIREVQTAYDIRVDFRHLSLLADYFTCEGIYKACSRQAINTCSSPIQQMSYETTFAFLKQALLQGLPDKMNSPSANILTGAPIKIGTNSFDILTKLTL